METLLEAKIAWPQAETKSNCKYTKKQQPRNTLYFLIRIRNVYIAQYANRIHIRRNSDADCNTTVIPYICNFNDVVLQLTQRAHVRSLRKQYCFSVRASIVKDQLQLLKSIVISKNPFNIEMSLAISTVALFFGIIGLFISSPFYNLEFCHQIGFTGN